MAVGVTFTDVLGRITTFQSESAADAMSRLSAVSGFNRHPSDALAESVASVWSRRRNRRAGRTEQPQGDAALLSGQVKPMSIITNVRETPDGHIFVDKQNGFLTPHGFSPRGNAISHCINEDGTGCGRSNL